MDAVVLAVDPGRDKCGLVLLRGETIIRRAVVPPAGLARVLREWVSVEQVERILVGDRTGMREVRALLQQLMPGIPLETVPEAGTTLEARRLYFAEHPPRGWRRLLPLSFQVPPEPYDDYAAAVLGRRYVRARAAPRKLH